MTVMISPSRIASLVVILFLSEPSAYCADAVRYTVKDLGEGVAVGINSAGSVLMNSNFRSAVKKGDGTSIHVGPEYGTATAINDVGDVVGKGSDDVVVGGAPYLWTPNGRSTYFEGELPLGLNNKRDMTIIYREPGTDCSTSGVPNSEDKAYAILDGKRIEVNNLNGSTNHVNSRAAAINSSGDFVGMANARECRIADPPQNETPRPFWYHQGRFSELSSE
jgi:hypothetical protein